MLIKSLEGQHNTKSALMLLSRMASLVVSWLILSAGTYVILSLLSNPWIDDMAYIPPVGHWQRTLLDFWLHGGVFLVIAILVGVNLYQFKQSLKLQQDFAVASAFHTVSNIAGVVGLILIFVLSATLIWSPSGLAAYFSPENYWEKYGDYRVNAAGFLLYFLYFLLFFVVRRKVERNYSARSSRIARSGGSNERNGGFGNPP